MSVQTNKVEKAVSYKSLSDAARKDAREKLAKKLQHDREKDRQVMRARFKYYECPLGEMKFVLKLYKEDDVEHHSFVDGQVYSVPIGVVRHVNKTCFNIVSHYALDEYGRASKVVGQKFQRAEFVPLEFIDAEDISPAGSNILTVQKL